MGFRPLFLFLCTTAHALNLTDLPHTTNTTTMTTTTTTTTTTTGSWPNTTTTTTTSSWPNNTTTTTSSCKNCSSILARAAGELFASNFDLECLNKLDETALEDAYTFFADNIQELQWLPNSLSMLFFIALLTSMEMSQLPDRKAKGWGGKVMFFVWLLLQFLLFVSQTMSLICVLWAYSSMHKNFGQCMKRWQDGMPLLHLISLLCAVWMPAILQRLLAIRVMMLLAWRALLLAQLIRTFRLFGLLQTAYDYFLFSAFLISLVTWLVTLSPLVGGVPLVPILLTMVFCMGCSLGFVYLVAVSFQRCRNSCCACWSEENEQKKRENEGEKEGEKGTYAGAVSWMKPVPKRIRRIAPQVDRSGRAEQCVRQWPREFWQILKDARHSVPELGYVCLGCMAVAPWVVASTWLTWNLYEDEASRLEEIWKFSFMAFLEEWRWPSVADFSELLDMVTDFPTFLDTLLNLGRELALPDLLLKRSRMWSSISLLVAIIKGALGALEKLLDGTPMCCKPWPTVEPADVLKRFTLQQLSEEHNVPIDSVLRTAAGLPEGDDRRRKVLTEMAQLMGVHRPDARVNDLGKRWLPTVLACEFRSTELENAGFRLHQLIDAGIREAELRAIGFSEADIQAASR